MKARARYESVTVDVGFQRYSVLCRVVPGRAAPHVGADSPRFMDPGKPDRAVIFSVSKDGKDVQADPDLIIALEKACAVKLKLRGHVTAAPARETQGTLGLEMEA